MTKDISIHSSSDSIQLKLHEPVCQKQSDTTNALHISDHGSELGEPFKLSMLNSPIANARTKKSLKELSALSSPYTENMDKQAQGRQLRDNKSVRLDAFMDAVLRKREGCAPETEPLVEYKLNFTKQLHRVKYYWRGTSLNYPFTYMRLRGGDEAIMYTEDYSGKRVNANDGLFN